MLIRGAFTDLLRQKPIQNITIKELCERAGINRGTFYSHYTDIYDLRDNIEDEMTREFQKGAGAASARRSGGAYAGCHHGRYF